MRAGVSVHHVSVVLEVEVFGVEEVDLDVGIAVVADTRTGPGDGQLAVVDDRQFDDSLGGG